MPGILQRAEARAGEVLAELRISAKTMTELRSEVGRIGTDLARVEEQLLATTKKVELIFAPSAPGPRGGCSCGNSGKCRVCRKSASNKRYRDKKKFQSAEPGCAKVIVDNRHGKSAAEIMKIISVAPDDDDIPY